jgi:hypothetical protein
MNENITAVLVPFSDFDEDSLFLKIPDIIPK